ncbi:MAG: transposase [Prosthecochloris sp.]|uniref:transposase n=1 Tax=Prosthecochloris sp. TaxID=290513 RepID=UPI0025871B2D|nr:transposase [Prosthecochloris sp.]MCW8798524.1 transposase [Prosthecochloris sp.]
MPRGSRLDAPGTLHHVMVRGINGNNIVMDDEDRSYFISRLSTVSVATGTSIYAWALMSNHIHLLLKSGEVGLATFMRKLLTGYAIYYNRRHTRQGYVFQNRYKSIVCEEERYFLKLVSYIHLNPLRAGLVESLDELDLYPWSGHAVVMKNIRQEWQDRAAVLRYFGDEDSACRHEYRTFVSSESGLGRQPELTGGGLIRSNGGWSEVKSLRRRGEKAFSDERILGSSDFVRELLTDVEGGSAGQLPVMPLDEEAKERLEQACANAGISVEVLQSGSRVKGCSALRKELAVEFVRVLGLSYAATARLLGVSSSAVKQIFLREGLCK